MLSLLTTDLTRARVGLTSITRQEYGLGITSHRGTFTLVRDASVSVPERGSVNSFFKAGKRLRSKVGRLRVFGNHTTS